MFWRFASSSFLYDNWQGVSYVVTFVHHDVDIYLANQGKEASGPKPSDCCEACQLATLPRAQAEDWVESGEWMISWVAVLVALVTLVLEKDSFGQCALKVWHGTWVCTPHLISCAVFWSHQASTSFSLSPCHCPQCAQFLAPRCPASSATQRLWELWVMQPHFLCQRGTLCWRHNKRKLLQANLFGVCWLVYWNCFFLQHVPMISNEMYQSHTFGMTNDGQPLTFNYISHLTCEPCNNPVQSWDCWCQVDVLISTCQTMSK